MGKLKRFKHIALRCEKTAENYTFFVAFALILIDAVHRAWVSARQRGTTLR